MRPWRSAIHPNNSAPISWPRKPAEIIKPIRSGESFQRGARTGRTDAIASASKASKKVATPTMMRVLICQADGGRRSSRATIVSIEEDAATSLIAAS
jgi:hypothetical protein